MPEWPLGWQLGTPDVVVRMPEPYVLRAEGPDVFRTFVLPMPTDTARFVRAVEFNPGNARAVHHANFGIDRTRSSRHLDGLDAQIGYEGGMVPDAAYPPGHMLGWTPGQRPRPSPDDAAWRLEPGSDVVVQLHMQPTGKPEPVQVSVALFFSDRPPTRTPVGIRLGSQTIDIAAGNASYIVADSYRLPVDVDLLAIQPHAHNLGRTMHAAASLPDGTTRTLIDIDDWDFRWQDVYRYAAPISLPRGTTISMRFSYDNSAANPRNPHRPPARVVWGQNTSDEMGDLWIQVVPRNRADLAALNDDVERKKLTEDLEGYTKILEADPANPLRHDQVALLLLGSGQMDRAVVHLRESLRLNASSAPTHYNLGLVLSMQRKLDLALAEFREAIRLDAGHADAYNNAAAMLHIMGRLGEATSFYRRAIELRSENADAHNNLGRLFTTIGQDRAAVDEFRRAVDLRPDYPSALAGLAWVLATSADSSIRNPREAVGAAAVEETVRAAWRRIRPTCMVARRPRPHPARRRRRPGSRDRHRPPVVAGHARRPADARLHAVLHGPGAAPPGDDRDPDVPDGDGTCRPRGPRPGARRRRRPVVLCNPHNPLGRVTDARRAGRRCEVVDPSRRAGVHRRDPRPARLRPATARPVRLDVGRRRRPHRHGDVGVEGLEPAGPEVRPADPQQRHRRRRRRASARWPPTAPPPSA